MPGRCSVGMSHWRLQGSPKGDQHRDRFACPTPGSSERCATRVWSGAHHGDVPRSRHATTSGCFLRPSPRPSTLRGHRCPTHRCGSGRADRPTLARTKGPIDATVQRTVSCGRSRRSPSKSTRWTSTSRAPSTWAAAVGGRPAAQLVERFEHAFGHAHLEEVAGGGGLRGGLDHLGRRTGRPGDLGQEFGVDLGAVEVGHHHAGGQLGDLADHADEDRPAHPGPGGPAEGDPGEVADLDDAHRRVSGQAAKTKSSERLPVASTTRSWPWAAATSICWTTDAR